MGKRNELGSNGGEHDLATRAIVAGVGALSVAAVAAAAKIIHDRRKKPESTDFHRARKQLLRIFSSFGSSPEDQAALDRAGIFSDPNISDRDKEVMARAAVQTQLKTSDGAESIAASTLQALLGPDVTESEFEGATARLLENRLLAPDSEDDEDNATERYFFATPALVRAIEDGSYQPLADAMYQIGQRGQDPVV